jgi:hypothetical protein
LIPNWLLAVSLLRMCGTARCLSTLRELAAQPCLPLNARTALAVTLERLVQRNAVPNHDAVTAILDLLIAGTIPGAFVLPQRTIGQIIAHASQAAASAKPAAAELMLDPPDGRVLDGVTPSESHLWQLHLVVARVRVALGLDAQPQARGYFEDPRAFVRRAFAAVLKAPVAAGASAAR